MTVYTRQGGLFEAGTRCIDVVGLKAERLREITCDEMERLAEAGVIKIAPTVRTLQMVEEYRHWRHSHVVELLPGAFELLQAWRSLESTKTSSAAEVEEARRLTEKETEHSKYLGQRLLKSQRLEVKLTNEAYDLRRELEEVKRELKGVKREHALKLRDLKSQLAEWAPAFTIGEIPIFLVEYSGTLEGARPQGAGVSIERQQTYLAKKATFKPDQELANVGYYCHRSKRVAWQLNNELIVVDDFGPSLAVHVVSSLELAKSMVSKAITIAEAKKSQHHLARIKHSEGYETSVLETLKEHAA